MRGRDNNLTLLRLIAATGVVYGHAFGVPLRDDHEPFHRLFGLGTGDLGVDVFFFISGLLITKSFLGRDLVSFAWARAARIFPGLWVSIVVLVGAAGLLFSPLGLDLWSRPDTLSYVARNATMLPGLGAQQALPFALQGVNPIFDAPLWTLPHELQMYMLLVLLGVVGALRSAWGVAAVTLAGLASIAVGKWFHVELVTFDRARFLYFFFGGSLVYMLRDHIVVSTRGMLLALALVLTVILASSSFMAREAVLMAVLPYLVLWFAYVPGGAIRQFNRVGDFSYGVYIYAFPIQLLLFGTSLGAGSLANFALSMLLVLPIAAASWYLVERHALRVPVPFR